MTTTTAPADRDMYVARILQAFAQSFRAETPTATADAIETAHRWAEAAEADGIDLWDSFLSLEAQAQDAYMAAETARTGLTRAQLVRQSIGLAR